MNWKAQATAAVKAAPEPVSRGTPDADLAAALRAMLGANLIAPRDVDFARSLLGGFDRYGGFTPRQLPHVERLVSTGGPQPESPDAPLAARLRDALPYLSPRDEDFARSLLAGFERYGGFTDRQRPYAERLGWSAPEAVVAASPAPVADGPAPVANPPPAAPPAPSFPRVAGLFGEGKFARFRGQGLALRVKNDMSRVWIKDREDARVLGWLEMPTGQARGRFLAEALPELEKIEADPMGYAKEQGLLTGQCACCGRALTDPESISIGIGPICLGKLGGL